MNRLKQVLIGVATDPAVVGAARALALYVLPLATAAAIAYLSGVRDPKWGGLALMAVPLIRALEGAVDRTIRPGQNDVNPGKVAGGGDSNLLN